jgi:hypothetical protein
MTQFPHLHSVLGQTHRGGAGALRLLVAVGAMFTLLALIPAISQGATKFGAELNGEVQPSNASEAHPCVMGDPGQCTRVSMEAYGRPDGGEKAPKSGTIKKIRIIAGEAGTFRPQVAEAKPGTEQAKVVAQGPKLNHGSSIPADVEDPYEVQSFKVDIPVKKGQYLALKSKETSILRCSSGGPNQLLFQPALPLGGPFATATDTDGCWLLMEAVIK